MSRPTRTRDSWGATPSRSRSSSPRRCRSRPGSTAIDVGCGPGALTAELVRRLGTDAVAAVDPSESFVEAARERLPGVDIRLASAESLPFESDSVDLTTAQLVVHFMSDPVHGLSEMARVTRPGGRVAANVWDHAGGQGPLSVYWRAARDLDPGVRDESGLAGAREGHLVELFEAAGLRDVTSFPLTVSAGYPDFATWWTTVHPRRRSRPASTSSASTTRDARRCERTARSCCRTVRSRSRPSRGRRSARVA